MIGPRADQVWHDRYLLVRRLGAGGMASVWLARDERLHRDVAVKVLSDVLAGDEEYIARFEREARVAAGLNHANLVTIFDFAVADGRVSAAADVPENTDRKYSARAGTSLTPPPRFHTPAQCPPPPLPIPAL